MRRLLGLAIFAGLCFPTFSADTKSSDQPSSDPTTKADNKKDEK
jgi:hypothetical protein